MNEHFVCIKVDREERPDVDAVCMEACQAITGHGGWPLNAFLTPDQAPFYVGTYFPPQSRQGMPSWRAVLEAVASAWTERREDVLKSSAQVLASIGASTRIRATDEPITEQLLHEAVDGLRGSVDQRNGGFGGAPKFPMASVIEFLLMRGEREIPLQTLRAMARGGIYDQVGGGFAATRSTRPGPCPTSRRCSTTTRCSRGRTCTAGRCPASRCSRASAARRSTGRCARCAAPRAASARRSTPTPRASRASSTCGRSTSCARRSADQSDDAIAYFGAARELRGGADVLEGRGPEPERLPEIRCKLLRRARRAGPARARRQATDVLERADDLGAGRGRRGAGARGLPGRRDRVRRVPARAAAWPATGACCGPTRIRRAARRPRLPRPGAARPCTRRRSSRAGTARRSRSPTR